MLVDFVGHLNLRAEWWNCGDDRVVNILLLLLFQVLIILLDDFFVSCMKKINFNIFKSIFFFYV